MLVTNLTAKTYVLSAGVQIPHSAVNYLVADVLYQTDSSLNEQLDRLQSQGFITISGKPADPFPTAGVFQFIDLGVVGASDLTPGVPLAIYTPAAGEFVLQTMAVVVEETDAVEGGVRLRCNLGSGEFAELLAGVPVGSKTVGSAFASDPVTALLFAYNGPLPAFPLPAWQANHFYADTAVIRDSNGGMQAATNDGLTSGGSEPTWLSYPSNTVDGDGVWASMGPDLPTTGKMHVYIVTGSL